MENLSVRDQAIQENNCHNPCEFSRWTHKNLLSLYREMHVCVQCFFLFKFLDNYEGPWIPKSCQSGLHQSRMISWGDFFPWEVFTPIWTAILNQYFWSNIQVWCTSATPKWPLSIWSWPLLSESWRQLILPFNDIVDTAMDYGYHSITLLHVCYFRRVHTR